MKKVLLCVLDGVGISSETKGNALKSLCELMNIKLVLIS